MSEQIGTGVCPVKKCGQPLKVNKAKNGFACYACSACKSQFFARGPVSNQGVLELVQFKPTATEPLREESPKPAAKPVTGKPAPMVEKLPPKPIDKPVTTVADFLS